MSFKVPLVAALVVLAGCAGRVVPGVDPLDAHDPAAPSALSAGTPLRIVAANVTSGLHQAYEDPGIRILAGLHADVALLQEFNYGANSDAELRAFVDQTFGPEFAYARQAGVPIANGVVSRFPILDSGVWDDPEASDRDFVWARIDVPGPTDLYAVSVHLLTRSSTVRDAEAQALVQDLSSLPAGAWVVVGGDFNTGSRSEPCLQTLAPLVATDGPYPTDENGNGNTNTRRSKPYDWLVANAALQARQAPLVIDGQAFAYGLVADTRVFAPIADLAPALASDSGATNMQHMAVARAFALPDGGPITQVTVASPNGGESWAAGSTHAITWRADGVDTVKLEVSLDGAGWSTLADGVPAAAGSFDWTVPATPTSLARVRVSAAPGGEPSDESDAPFNITAAGPARVFVNELLANEPGADPAGEFVEIVNGGDGAVDLSGWTLSDALRVRHTFAAGTILPPGGVRLVYGGAEAIPAGLPDAVAASTGQLALTNAGDTVTLADAAGAVVDRVAYPRALGAIDGVSMNRAPDGDSAGGFVLHTTLAAAASSPGTRVDGAPF